MLTDNLAKMLELQRELQQKGYRIDPMTLMGDERATFMQWNAFALEDELHEAFAEVGWKPWATSRHLNGVAFLKEMVDAWHFFMNLLLVAAGEVDGIKDADDLSAWFTKAYIEKRTINLERQRAGYDGVSTKCATCHRDYAESECRPGWCQEAALTQDDVHIIR